jgi:hypothetical protein
MLKVEKEEIKVQVELVQLEQLIKVVVEMVDPQQTELVVMVVLAW